MNHKNQLILTSALVLFLLFSFGKSKAEGTKQLSPAPTDSAMLHTNASGFGLFAAFGSEGTTSALNVSIKDFTTEILYIGLSAEADDNGMLSSTYTFRIVDSIGNIVHGPFTIGTLNDNADTWAEACGPDVLTGGGYSTDTTPGNFPYAIFVPPYNGEFSLQFDDGGPEQIANILWYDFTVSDGVSAFPGRLWSRNWALRTPPRLPNTLPECSFDRPFNGVFYSYTMDGFVSRLDFDSSGFQGLSFTVSFGDVGPGNSGNVILDRRSVNDTNQTANNADHMVFLNDPDTMLFPSSLAQCGTIELLSVSCESADSFCINIGITQPGQVEVILDFNDNGMYDDSTEDVLLAMILPTADSICIPWNGLKGDSTPIEFGEEIPTVIRYSQGVQHYAAYDVEFLKFGFCVQTIRPICPGISTDLLYWDDTQITDDVATTTIDEGDPGTNQPKIQLNGCACGVDSCRTWTTFQIGDPPSGTCTGTPFGYGENATLNTWWYANTIILDDINLPFAQVLITGDSVICAGDSAIFCASVFPDTLNYDFIWSGPGAFTSTDSCTGPIGTPGTYYVTISDPLTNCSATDSAVLIVNANPTTTIGFTCIDPNQENADVNLTVMGGLMPYGFLWSNGAMTEDLFNVPPGQYSVIVTDANGCMAFDTILVEGCCDLVVICPPANGGTFQCVQNVPTPAMHGIVVTQYCDTFNITSMDSDNGGTGCPLSPLVITRVFTVADNSGNMATCTVTYTVIDNMASITCPADVTVQCASDVPTPNPGGITATDNCGGPTIVTFAGDVTSNFMCINRFTVTRTYLATDACGNTGTCTQTITVFDNIAPALVCPPNTTIQCTASTLPANTGTATATDNCAIPMISFTDVTAEGGCPQEPIITRTWSATDGCGNTSTCTQTITVEDSTPPLVLCPSSVTIQCTASTLPANTGTATATDNCSTPAVTFSDVVVGGGCPQERTITRTWSATDGCGNTSTCTQTITVEDNVPPVISCPSNVTIQCSVSTLPAVTGSASATDNCSMPAITFSDVTVTGGCTQERTITRTWSATDGCGNTSTCTQTISVEDSTPPVLSCPSNVTVECTASTLPVNTGTATATDNCSAPATTFSDVFTSGGCPSEFTITRTWSATDGCGNTSTCTQTITVDDSTPPVIVCPSNVTIQCTASTLPATTGTATATDNCSTPGITFSDVTVAGGCAQERTITRTWLAMDACGNTSTCAQSISVDDSTPPAITCPTDVTVQCASAVPPGNPASVTTSDNCGGTPMVTFADVTTNMTCPNNFTLTRTYTSTDACGNSATCAQVITVLDNTVPTITCPANTTVSCATAIPAPNIGSVMAMDNCGGVTITFVSDVNSNQTCPNNFTVTRTYQATDLCGNTATCSQTIIVNDAILPVAICQDFMIDFGSETTVTITPDDIDNGSTDNCGPVTLSLSQTEFNCEEFIGQSSVPVTLTVTDACGNTSTCVAQVSGIGGALEINCPDDITVTLGPGECVAFVNYVVTADAICGGSEVTIVQIDNSGLTSGDGFPIGVTIQTYQAFNESDTVECSFTITVIEADIPVVLACNDTINISVDANCEAHIFADMILEGDQYGCYDDFIISVESFGSDTGWIVVFGLPLGECYSVTITDPETGNSCWGTICLEDKLPPQIICACPPGGEPADSCVISCLEVDLLVAGNIPINLQPEVIENCDDYEVDILDILVDDEGCGEGTIIVTWIVTDGSGMTATCVQEFAIEPLSIDSVVFPPNYEGICGSSSHPSITGWPQVNGIDLTDQAGLCNLFMGYWDKILQDCGGGTKILRTWTVLDWCTLELIEATQIIKLSDLEGPILTCPPNITAGTDFWYCYANVSVPKPIAYDECSDVVSFSLYVSAGIIIQFGNNFVVNELPLGVHQAIWTVTDLCGNSSTCSFTITVVDDAAPVALCDEHTVVALTTDGTMGITLVPADVFDDGSYDACGPVTFTALRMTEDNCDPDFYFDWTTQGACVDHIPNGSINSQDRGNTARPCVPFFCCDVGRGPIMVQLIVTDAAGNENFCMVEVEVQDKIPPFIECPPDITVSCDFWFGGAPPVGETYNYEDVDGNHNGNVDEDPLSHVFGNMRDAFRYNDNESYREDIIINDPGALPYITPQPHFWGIDGWADDNCEVNLSVRVRTYGNCSGDDFPAIYQQEAPAGAVRLIERRFLARDGQGNSEFCTQLIWVVDFDPFYISDETCHNDNPNDGVIWPCDVILTTCPDDLSGLEGPVVYDDACSLIGIAFEDTRFNFVDGACFKILREWSVIDWCQYNPSTGHGLWKYVQVIKVHDHDGPEFLDCPAGPVVLCVADPGVTLPDNNQAFLGEDNPLSSSCSAHLNLCKTVYETCSDYVRFDVKIYLNNGVSFIQVKPLTSVPVDSVTNTALLCFDTHETPIQEIRLNGIPYNSPWCGDYHRILWTVEDDCGNFSTCEYLFRLEDCKQPSPVCINGLSTVVMPIGGQVTIWAKDFDASSFDDCTPSEELLFSFSGDSYQPSFTYTCDNVPAFGVELSVNIWVADGGTDDNCNSQISWNERNKDYCTTTIVITDNEDVCDTIGSIVYEGEIFTEHDQSVGAALVSLLKDDVPVYAMSTPDDGHFKLIVPQEDGVRYKVEPKRNDNHRNGVSTLDLVRIQKHLLGKELFNSPYQYIAADATNNQQVSAIDLVEIRKLILGIYNEFPNNQSWRFVDVVAGIPDETHPWPFEEVINIQYDGVSHSNMDFVGVKIGDVNNTVQAHATQVLPRDGRRVLNVKAEANDNTAAGEIVNLTLTIPESLVGFQWTLETNGLEFIDVSSENIEIGDEHVGIFRDGIITMSWHQTDLSKGPSGQIKIVVQVKAVTGGNVLDKISLTGSKTIAEAYSVSEEILDVRLNKGASQSVADFALYQNEPNPWTGLTSIRFDLPENGLVKLTLFDVTGKMIKVIEKTYEAGSHTITLNKKDLTSLGVLYYRLDSGNYSATKKMIRVE